MTEVVKNLIIINLLFFLATDLLDVIMTSPIGDPFGSLKHMLGIYYFGSETFRPFQIATSMFTHGDFMHIAFNMLTLFFLGPMMENRLGAKKFLLLYLVSGIGATILHILWHHYEVQSLMSQVSPENFAFIKEKGYEVIQNNRNYADPVFGGLNSAYNGMAVGASGCISGVIMAWGMLYPNLKMQFLLIPFAFKAKHIAIFAVFASIVYGFMGVEGDNTAHFAHLGGLLTGYIVLRIWGEGYLLR